MWRLCYGYVAIGATLSFQARRCPSAARLLVFSSAIGYIMIMRCMGGLTSLQLYYLLYNIAHGTLVPGYLVPQSINPRYQLYLSKTGYYCSS